MSEIVICSDASTLAARVATDFVDLLKQIQSEGRIPRVCLTGGTIAKAAYEAILAAPRSSEVAWDRVDFWWGDERYVGASSPDRNDSMARLAFLDQLGADPARMHPMPAADGPFDTLEDAAVAYDRALADITFDLLLLGMGPDGHVASLFPDYPQLDVVETRAVAVPDSPKPPPQRVSLTLPTLNYAARIWLLVSGQEKAAAAADAINGTRASLPAARVRGSTQTCWYLDNEAACELD